MINILPGKVWKSVSTTRISRISFCGRCLNHAPGKELSKWTSCARASRENGDSEDSENLGMPVGQSPVVVWESRCVLFNVFFFLMCVFFQVMYMFDEQLSVVSFGRDLVLQNLINIIEIH